MRLFHGLSLLTTAAAIVVTCHRTPARAEEPSHEKETAAAWEAFAKGQYQDAIARANICIREFRGTAGRRQAELTAKREVIPNGRVDARQKKQIFNNGPLNDVATCYYVKGRAADKLGQKDVAAIALAEAVKLPAARAWDDKGRWFWSPAESAQLYLKNPELADKAPHEIYTAEAWAAFEQRQYAQASAHAKQCLDQFQQAAAGVQMELATRGVELPVGAVPDDIKKKIFENGMLNDVAACLFIKGRSAEEMGDRISAINTYQEAVKLTYGRCWDPKGWFWSPAEACADRLQNLR